MIDAIDNEESLRQKVEELMMTNFRSDWNKILKLDATSSKEDLNRLRSYLTEESLDGKEVKSRPEKRVADYLFEHNIPYRYEMPFPVDDGQIIRPDFYFKSGTKKIVLEYYGLRGMLLRKIIYKRAYWETRKKISF